MKLLIDVHKIPRPERSGLISILCMYVLLSAISDVQMNSYPESFKREIGGWKAVACYLIPCSLLPGFYKKQEEQQKVKELRIKFVPLVFGPGKGGKPICACHIDYWLLGKPVQHLHFSPEITCDSEWPSEEVRHWRVIDNSPSDRNYSRISIVTSGDFIPLYTGDKYRYHCTTDDNK